MRHCWVCVKAGKTRLLKLNAVFMRTKKEVVFQLYLSYRRRLNCMTITLGMLVIWLIIAIVVGFIGELLARRRAPDGIIGAAVVGFIAIFLIVGVFHFSIVGEPTLDG